MSSLLPARPIPRPPCLHSPTISLHSPAAHSPKMQIEPNPAYRLRPYKTNPTSLPSPDPLPTPLQNEAKSPSTNDQGPMTNDNDQNEPNSALSPQSYSSPPTVTIQYSSSTHPAAGLCPLPGRPGRRRKVKREGEEGRHLCGMGSLPMSAKLGAELTLRCGLVYAKGGQHGRPGHGTGMVSRAIQGQSGVPSRPAVSGWPVMRLAFWTA